MFDFIQGLFAGEHKEIWTIHSCAAENIPLKYRLAPVKKNLKEKENNAEEEDWDCSLTLLSVSIGNNYFF